MWRVSKKWSAFRMHSGLSNHQLKTQKIKRNPNIPRKKVVNPQEDKRKKEYKTTLKQLTKNGNIHPYQ